MKPGSCINQNCTGGENCTACIMRSVIAYKGHLLVQAIEKLPPSIHQTEAVNMATDLISHALGESITEIPYHNKCGLPAELCTCEDAPVKFNNETGLFEEQSPAKEEQGGQN